MAVQRTHYGDLDGTVRPFHLRIGETLELERVTGRSIGEIAQRFGAGSFYYADVRAAVRLGLIGGGSATPAEAEALCVAYVDGQPIIRAVEIACRAVDALILGLPEVGDAGKAPAEPRPETAPPSTAPAP